MLRPCPTTRFQRTFAHEYAVYFVPPSVIEYIISTQSSLDFAIAYWGDFTPQVTHQTVQVPALKYARHECCTSVPPMPRYVIVGKGTPTIRDAGVEGFMFMSEPERNFGRGMHLRPLGDSGVKRVSDTSDHLP